MKWITRIFWFWYVVGFILMVFFAVPDWLQFSKSLFLVFFAMYALSILWKDWQLTWKQRMWILVPVGFLSLWIEAIGTATGWPFGHYTYGEKIGWKLLDVPITISFAWLAIVTTVILFSVSKPRWLRAFEVGLWAMCFDLILDPAAVAEGYWQWHTPAIDSSASLWQVIWSSAAFYGIPLSNFITWFVVAFVLSFFYPVQVTSRKKQRQALRLYQAMLLMFGALCLKAAFWLPIILVVLFIVASEWRVRYDSREAKPMV